MAKDDDNTDDDFQTTPKDINPMEDMKKDEKLPGDFNTPFSPPSGAQDRINDTHPSTDTNIDKDEHYQRGIEGAASVDLPGEAAEEDQDLPETGDD